MNIHEYQAKALLAKFGVPLLKGGVAYTKDEAMDVARRLGTPVVVVKSQIEAGAEAGKMLGHDLVTKQTGPGGRTVKRLYVEEGVDIKRELYLSMLGDRA